VSRLLRATLLAFTFAAPVASFGAAPALAHPLVDGSTSVAVVRVVGRGSQVGETIAAQIVPTDAPQVADGVPAASPDAPPADAAPADAPAPVADESAAPIAPIAAVTTYTVQANDTLFAISKRHGVSVDAIRWANGLTDANSLKLGQKLAIPPSSGTLYMAKDGDTVESVAKANGVSVIGIATVNGLAEDATIGAGRTLLIPAPRQAAAAEPTAAPVTVTAAQAAPPAPIPAPAATPAPVAVTSLVSSSAPLVKATESPTPAPTSPAASGTPSVSVTTRKLPKLAWPIDLKPPRIDITQRFRPGHTGIDIGAPEGTPIKAMASGTVTKAEKGYNGGYGWLVIVDHGDSMFTWYAHLSEISVSAGDQVQTGQKVGGAGATGRSSGPHLHFELRVGNTPINPLLALE